MEAADPGGTARREQRVGRRLAELSERQGWVHHVVDADTGELLTTPLDRPLSPLSRAERLAQLGHQIDLPRLRSHLTSRRSSAASSPSPSRRAPGPERWGRSRSRDRPTP